MIHKTTPEFWSQYDKLPNEIKAKADKAFNLLKNNSNHPSLHLKKIKIYYSARIDIKYRVLGIEIQEGILWFWIGTHTEYDKIV